jgi:hypothetical protein
MDKKITLHSGRIALAAVCSKKNYLVFHHLSIYNSPFYCLTFWVQFTVAHQPTHHRRPKILFSHTGGEK